MYLYVSESAMYVRMSVASIYYNNPVKTFLAQFLYLQLSTAMLPISIVNL